MTILYQGEALPDFAQPWLDSSGAVIPFGTGYAFELRMGPTRPPRTTSFVKTTGITGADTSPNITISWSTTGELNSLTPGLYLMQIKATRTSDSKPRIMQTKVEVRAALGGTVTPPTPPSDVILDGGGP